MGKEGEQQTVFFLNAVHAHDDSADFGTDPKNPIQLPNIPMAYAYLDSLYFEDGTDVIFARVSTCHTDTGHTMDVYSIRRQGSNEIVCHLYFDCYVQGAGPKVPKGFYIKAGDRILRPEDCNRSHSLVKSSSGKGCIVPIVLTIGSLVAASVAICCKVIR